MKELKLLYRLQKKLRTQDPGIIILPDDATRYKYAKYEDPKPDTPISDDLSGPETNRSQHTSQVENAPENGSDEVENELDPLPEPDYTIKPIQPTQIPHTDWRDHPHNPRRRY